MGTLLWASAPAAVAQDEAVLLRALRDGRDFRVRAQAAFALGRKGDLAFVIALETALYDKHPVVRAAAAAALGRVATRSSLSALRLAMRDGSPAVVEQATASIATIEQRWPTAAKAASPQRARARYALVVGEAHNESGFAGGELAQVLQATLQRELPKLKGAVVVSAQAGGGAAEARSQGLGVVRVEGNVTQIEPALADGQLSVHCEVSLLLMDDSGHNLRSVLKGAATGIEAEMGPRAAQQQRLARKAVDGAVRSALRNAAQVLERASVHSATPASGAVLTATAR